MSHEVKFVYSQHAEEQRAERRIKHRWIEDALRTPDRKLRRKNRIHYLKSIPEFGGLYLRVIVDPDKSPIVVITVYFDGSLS